MSSFGFVNDTYLIQIVPSRDDFWDVATHYQSAVKLWKKCTDTSGGCLVPAKSWWTLMDFSWHEGRWTYSNDMDDVSIDINDVDR